jgi:hypothetical protein
MVRLLKLSGLFLLLAALAPHTASAGVREKILRECQDGRLSGNYTPAQLRDARKHIPTDIDEYSDCRDVLARASISGGTSSGGAGGAGGGGGVGSAAPGGVQSNASDGLSYAANKGEQDELAKALSDGSEGTDVGGQEIIPGATGLGVNTARHELPANLLIPLILVGLCAAALAAPALRRRVIARRHA